MVERLAGSSQRSPPSLQIIRSDQAVKLVRAQADARTTAAARLAAVEALLPSSGIKLAFCAAQWRVQRRSQAGAARLQEMKIQLIRRGSPASASSNIDIHESGVAFRHRWRLRRVESS